MALDDSVMTIDSDAEDVAPTVSTSKSKAPDADDVALDANFDFDFADEFSATPFAQDEISRITLGTDRTSGVSIDDIIARRRLTNATRKRKVADVEESASEKESEDELDSAGSAEDGGWSDVDDEDEPKPSLDQEEEEDEDDPLASSDEDDDRVAIDEDDEDAGGSSGDESDMETQAERDRKAAFFGDSSDLPSTQSSFVAMNLSRPILKALTSLGFNTPTPIQAATIPVALLGKDVVGNAVTGSGKTAAFIIPMIERLLHREKGRKAAATRCLVLVPTRELGVQCFEVGKKLSAHTDIQFCLAVGGLSVKAQETALRTRPDVVIATPGRLIDHIRNSPAFNLDALDILVLDEADRMLSDGFADELAEIIRSCPTSRQTMLFSATMADSVDELVKMSLNKPIRLFVDPKRSTAKGLVQEFVRVRKEDERSAMLVAICKRTFRYGVIVFFRSKKLAHQLRVMFSLLGMKCDELHGDLTQEQRLRALQAFRDREVDYLMATDLASRGLDIKGVETVINYDMPGQLDQYLHRVGRTARAGKKGKSVTLVGESDRKMLKAAIKYSTDQVNVRHRIIPNEAVFQWSQQINALKDEVTEILQEEKEQKQLRQAERDIKKGENLVEHEKEIFSRPARTWFQSVKDKAKSEALSKDQYVQGSSTQSRTVKAVDDNKPKRDKLSGLTRRAKRRKLALMDDAEANNNGAVSAAIRSAKKTTRPVKIGDKQPKPFDAKSKKRKGPRVSATSFDRDLGQKRVQEGARARKTDSVNLSKKGGKKRG